MRFKTLRKFFFSIIYISIFAIFYSVFFQKNNYLYANNLDFYLFSYVKNEIDKNFLYNYDLKESLDYVINKLKQRDSIIIKNRVKTFYQLYIYLSNLRVSNKIYKDVLVFFIDSLKDPYSQYLPKEEADKVRRILYSKEFYGLGLQLTIKGKNLVVCNVIKGSSSDLAGIKIGDVLVSVNSEKVKNISDATYKLYLDKGESVLLEFKRKDKLFKRLLTAKKIQIKDLTYRYDKNYKILYIKISLFTDGLSKRFLNILKTYKDAKYLVLDLKNNPGGVKNEAINIADFLLPKNSIITYIASKRGVFPVKSHLSQLFNGKIFVLINQASASSSELLTASLKYNNRAKVLGIKSMGKGRIQTIYNIFNSDMLILTTNAFLTPDKKDIHHKGIKPDIYTLHPLEVVYQLIKGR